MKRLLLSVAFAAIAFTGSPAFAQDADGTEIIVTAQRREQNVQDVGVAVSVVSGQELLDQGVNTVNGLENLAPSLEVESQFGGGQPSYSLRGVGFRDYASNNAPTVGVYVDEVAYTLPIMTQGVLFDVERVEILRGPQGTLYGRNTTGGAINVISARPRDEFAAGFNAEYGNYDAVRAEGYVNWALGGGAAARISGALAQGGAWQTNRETGAELGDADRYALRGQFLIPATDNLEFLLNIHGFRDQSDGLGLILFKNFAGAPSGNVPGGFVPAAVAHEHDQTSWGFSPQFRARNGISPAQGPFRDNEGVGASLRTTYDFGAAGLTYVLSHEQLDRRELNDWDALPGSVAGVLFTSEADVTQHELRLASQGDSAFDWIVGVYAAEENLSDNYQSDFQDSFGSLLTNAQLSTPYTQVVETRAIFGQVEFQAAPTVNLIAGIRYEDEERRLEDFVTTFGGGATIPVQNLSTEMQEVSGRLAVEWTPSDNLLYYASVSRGVKSGGFTAYNTFNPAAVEAFEPEVLIAYEVGFKADLLDRRLRLNGAAFYYDYSDQQVQNGVFLVPQNIPVGRITNAPSSTIYGAELELLWRATDALTITQAIGYQHGEFDEFSILDIAASGGGVAVFRDASGERLGPPEVTYNGSVSYEGALGANWGWTGSIDYSYRGDTDPALLKPVSGEGYGVPDYWLVNANVSFTPNDGPWQVGLWARNLLDEEYHETRNFFANADYTPIAAPGLPRTYGVRIAYRH